MAAKRYYWLKLGNTYFSQLEQKKMRKQKDGMNMQVIYLRMMLLSIDKDGYIYYQGVYDSIEEELAEEFSEDIELVRRTVEYLQDNNMLEVNDSDYFLPQAVEYTGSECYSAERMRRLRQRRVSQSDNDVTRSDEEKELEKKLEKKLEERQKTNSVDYQQIADMYNNTCVSFPRLSKLSESRKKAIKARLQTYSVEDFQRMFEMAEGSSFLKGANNRNWSATFDWMVKDANMAKILDGNYQDRQSESQIPEKTPEEIEREKREEQEALDRIERALKEEYVYDPEHPFQ